MKVTTLGIDLAKNLFQVHGVNEYGKVVIKKQMRRDQLAEVFVKLPACLIGMEACGGAHHWARKLQGFGHSVKLMAPQFVVIARRIPLLPGPKVACSMGGSCTPLEVCT